eukprot:2024248-Pleurochrysis_carterae.AAC.1
MAKAVLVTALVTAGIIHSLQNGDGGRRTATLRVTQSLIAIAVTCVTSLAILIILSPFARASLLFV